MNRYLIIQSNTFIGITLLAITSSFMIVDNLGVSSVLAFILAIAFFGVPHGSLDTLFAKKAFKLITLLDWVKFMSVYLLISLSVFIFWVLFPNLFFTIFLCFSAIHFSDDLGNIQPKLISFLYGFNIITLPSILHPNELSLLYGYLVDTSYSISIVSVMKPLAVISLLLTIVLLITLKRERKSQLTKRHQLEIAAVSVLMLIVEPLFAFTIYFCFMHSARHILRAKFYFNDFSKKTLMLTLILPTLAVIIFCVLIFQMLPSGKFDENLIKVTFATLAALTFPHAFLLYRVGFLNWLKSNSAYHHL